MIIIITEVFLFVYSKLFYTITFEGLYQGSSLPCDENLIGSMKEVASHCFKGDYSKENDLYKHIEKKS